MTTKNICSHTMCTSQSHPFRRLHHVWDALLYCFPPHQIDARLATATVHRCSTLLNEDFILARPDELDTFSWASKRVWRPIYGLCMAGVSELTRTLASRTHTSTSTLYADNTASLILRLPNCQITISMSGCMNVCVCV